MSFIFTDIKNRITVSLFGHSHFKGVCLSTKSDILVQKGVAVTVFIAQQDVQVTATSALFWARTILLVWQAANYGLVFSPKT